MEKELERLGPGARHYQRLQPTAQQMYDNMNMLDELTSTNYDKTFYAMIGHFGSEHPPQWLAQYLRMATDGPPAEELTKVPLLLFSVDQAIKNRLIK